MKAPIQVICRPEVAPGVGLSGLAITEVVDGVAAAAILDGLADAPAAGGVVLLEQVLLDALPPLFLRRIRKRGVPILVPFPSPSVGVGPGRAAEEEVLEILRRAVGYRLRLR